MFKGLEQNAVVSLPNDRDELEEAFRVLGVSRLPMDIVLDRNGFVTFVGNGHNSLRSAWRWVKYKDRFVDPLSDVETHQ
jgi:hypothetical protein